MDLTINGLPCYDCGLLLYPNYNRFIAERVCQRSIKSEIQREKTATEVKNKDSPANKNHKYETTCDVGVNKVANTKSRTCLLM